MVKPGHILLQTGFVLSVASDSIRSYVANTCPVTFHIDVKQLFFS